MTIELKIGQLNTSNASDGDLLSYVGANGVVEYRDIVSDIDSRVLANVNAVQDNVDTFASYANSTFVSSVSGTANEIDVSGSTSVTLSLPDNLIAPGDLTVTGNLTVSGNTTYVNTETLEVEDNIITLNSSLGSGVTPTENAGLEVNRGAQANVQFRWNETLETWEYGEVDTSDFTRVDESQSTVVLARNESGSTIAAGVPVYITGYSAGGSRPTIAPADADLAGAMPALGITLESANTNSNQRVVAYGTITTLNTSSFVPGDELYVSATAGTLQNTRPTGSSTEIQKIAKVLRSDATDGSIIVMGAGRTNAIPNIPTDHVFIGDGGATHTTINLNATIQTQSAANDYSTYTTLVSLIDTVQDNVTTSDNNVWVNANDYTTYTTLSGLIDTVNANVDALPDSAANDHSTYTTLSGLINTVQDNVSASDNNVWVNANDHATYTAVSSLVDTVQANLSTDVAVLDSFASYANSNFALSNEAVTFADLEVANLVVSGDFTIVGDVTTIESNNTVVSDPLILLNNGVSGANTLDAGFIINRGSSSNVALYYDESEDVLQVGYTTQGAEDSDITLDSRVIIRSDTVRAGNVEVGAGALRNEITAIGDQNLKISGNTLQAGNIEIASNVIPTQNAVFSIGSPTAQLKDIYVSDGTIFIGTNSQISAESVSLTNFNVDSDGTIRIPGVNISADANAVETVEIIASDLASNTLIQTQINTTVGFLTELNTTTQDNVVAAINELVTNIGTVSDNASGTSDSTSDQFTITTANAFTLSSSVSEANNIIVSVSGLVQLPNDDYVVSGTTLTLNNTTPLPQGASVEVRHLTSSGGSGGSTDFTAVASNIVPSANNVYSLGSPDKIWKDLYLANGTIYIGDTKISTTADGNVEFRSSSTDTRKTIEVDDLVIGSGSNRKRFRVDESGKFRLGTAAIDPDSDKDVSAEIDNVQANLTSFETSALSKIDTVQANLTSVIGAAPTTLDTLAEIAAALENDANVAVTLTNQISTVDTDAKANTYNTYVTLNNKINTVSDNAAASGGSSSSTEAWEIISTNQTLTANTNYFVDVSSSARTVTLPSSPALGTKIHIVDVAGKSGVNNITVGRNSQKIQRLSEDLVVSSNSASFTLIYSNSTYGWILGEI